MQNNVDSHAADSQQGNVMQSLYLMKRKQWLREKSLRTCLPNQVAFKPGVWIASDSTARHPRAAAGHGATAKV